MPRRRRWVGCSGFCGLFSRGDSVRSHQFCSVFMAQSFFYRKNRNPKFALMCVRLKRRSRIETLSTFRPAIASCWFARAEKFYRLSDKSPYFRLTKIAILRISCKEWLESSGSFCFLSRLSFFWLQWPVLLSPMVQRDYQ